MPDREAMKFIRTTFTGYMNTPVKDIFGASVLVLAAHPDDETIGAGALYRYLEKVAFAHATDGAPRDLVDTLSHGFSNTDDYAKARRGELLAALWLSGVESSRCLQLGLPDQEASLHLVELTIWVKDRLKETRPETVLTLAYEGGHPDHDSVSFAAHAAVALLKKEGEAAPPLIEFPLYHAIGNGSKMMRTGFLPREDVEPITFILTEEERRHKREMMERFTSQAAMLRHFTVEQESFRPAPKYDFTEPPHEGRLYYEDFDWKEDGAGWRGKAREALARLGLEGRL